MADLPERILSNQEVSQFFDLEEVAAVVSFIRANFPNATDEGIANVLKVIISESFKNFLHNNDGKLRLFEINPTNGKRILKTKSILLLINNQNLLP